MTGPRPHRGASEADRGSVTVEAALGIASLVVVLAVAASGAAAALTQIRVVDAAREAARVAALVLLPPRSSRSERSSLPTPTPETTAAMGLSGATKKQRIQDDPRNMRWAQGQPRLPRLPLARQDSH